MKLCREALLIRMSRAESRQWLISTQSSLSCHPHSARVTLNWRPQRALCVSTSEVRTAGDNESSPRSFTMVGRVQHGAAQRGDATAVHPPVTPHSRTCLPLPALALWRRQQQPNSRLLGFPLQADHFFFFIFLWPLSLRCSVTTIPGELTCVAGTNGKSVIRVVAAAAATDD